jgi:anion-transporting  ArsA/GET3 family ATPase
LRLGGGYMAQMLARWTSSEYVSEFAEFMTTFDQMFQDMEVRVRTMDDVLSDAHETSLNLVSTAEEEAADQTARLYDEVTRALAMPISACVVNRAYLPAPPPPSDLATLARKHGASAEDAASFARDADEAARFYAALAEDHARYAAWLRERIAAPVAVVPALAGSVHDLGGLEKVRSALFSGTGP